MKKGKLITSLCMLILSLACLTFGVYSAVKTSFTASGTITFNAYGVECDVAIKVVGAEGGDKVLYATTNKTNAKRVAVETRNENSALGLVANYTADSTTVIGGSDTINLGELKFDELNATKSDAERKTITMEVYVINYSDFAIEFQADSDGQNGDGSVTYKREMEELGIELDKYTTGAPTSNVGKNTTCAYKIVFTANSQSTSNNAFSVNFTIKPATGKTGAEATAYKYATKDDFETVETVIDAEWWSTEGASLTIHRDNWTKCKNTTNTKMIVPLIYCDSNKNIVDESTSGAVLMEITGGGTAGENQRLPLAMFATQTDMAFCVGYESVGDFAVTINDEYSWGQEKYGIIKRVILPDSISVIKEFAFFGCWDLGSIRMPASATSIARGAFENCTSLSSIDIPKNVTNISEDVFNGCESLTSITIPSSVTSVGGNVFYGCSSLSFEIKDGAKYLTDTSGKKLLYKAENTSITSCTIDANTRLIWHSAFYGCKSLTSITIPSSVTSIGNSAFYNCSSLTSIRVPDGVTRIGVSTFYGCSSITSITIPSSVTSIETSAFSACSSLTSITIPSNVTSIGYRVFEDCNSLTTIKIPDGVTSIESYAFDGCSSLTSITNPSSVTNIGKSAFSGCTNLTKAKFENATGWSVSTSQSGTYTSITTPTTEMTAANATLLTSTYSNYYWKRG